MVRYAGLRVLQAIVVLWASFTVAFVVLFILPSDPVSIAVQGDSSTPVDKQAIADLQARYGLDQSLLSQYWTSLSHAVRGDFGTSISTGQPVTTAIGNALPSTLELAVGALVLAVLFGTLIAFATTYTRAQWLRSALQALPPLGVAIPTFWVGLMLLQVFSFNLRLFPAFGDKGFSSVVLPAITLALPTGAVIAQVLASSMGTTWRQPFVETAQAKGASRIRVVLHHVVRLASIPALTIAGVLVGNLLAGAVVVETVFSRAGVGRLTQTSVMAQDIPVVLGIVVLSTLVFVSVNLIVDLLYPLIDPRIVENTRKQKEPEPDKTAVRETQSEAAHV
jgi:peptide/nickel transport system permease protein